MRHIQNAVLVSVLEAREIAKKLYECVADVKMGVPITECDLDVHLDGLMKVVERVFEKDQPSVKDPEVPM